MDQALADHHHGDTGESNLLVLTGMAGVGKTALAAHWARRVADRFPDGQLWLDLRGGDRRSPEPSERMLASILRALGAPALTMPSDVDGLVGRYRSMMDGRRMLVVLDNAAGVEQVLPLLPGDARTFVLITSRSDLAMLVAVEGARAVRLDPLTPDESRRMLEARLGAERVRAESGAVNGIVSTCCGLPLALAIVAARAVSRPHFSLSVVDHEFTDAGRPLERFVDPTGTLDVRTAFSWSYRSVSTQAARMFRLLGEQLAADFSVPAAAALADTTAPQVRSLLDELAAAHLVIEHAPGRFALNGLLRAYAAELAVAHDCPVGRPATRSMPGPPRRGSMARLASGL